MTISIGGEIGEVGKNNSTVEELEAFVEGFNEFCSSRRQARPVEDQRQHRLVAWRRGAARRHASRRSRSTSRRCARCRRRLARYGMGGAVQHGASTLPAEPSASSPRSGTRRSPPGDGVPEHHPGPRRLPDDLKQQMYALRPREAGRRVGQGRHRGAVHLQDAQEDLGSVQATGLDAARRHARGDPRAARREARLPVRAARRGRLATPGPAQAPTITKPSPPDLTNPPQPERPATSKPSGASSLATSNRRRGRVVATA